MSLNLSSFKPSAGLSSNSIIVLTSLFLLLFANARFFSDLLGVYPVTRENIVFLISVAALSGAVLLLLLSLVCNRYTMKPVLILVLLSTSVAAYFMDSFGSVIDHEMIRNMVATDSAEVNDLVTQKLFFYILLLGVVPSLCVYLTPVSFGTFIQELLARTKLTGLALISIVVVVVISSGHFSSFFREHKALRSYSNPTFLVYSMFKAFSNVASSQHTPFKSVAEDAMIPDSDIERELVVFVVGETARADRFSLNGYDRETNPVLQQEDLVSFTNVWSCGTSTDVSVPCMFSILDEDQYDREEAANMDNVLDILERTEANVLWLDNNSDSKRVADRVEYIDYRSSVTNSVCDVECRDEGMLGDLGAYINSHAEGDIFIVLHQMGNHGPAYHKRYPPEFEYFTPACKTNQIEQCSDAQISNAYDNAIRYTDAFLGKLINLLKDFDQTFETAMMYVSDHGESLGENGLYLHGYPKLLAPDTQMHVPAIFWQGASNDDTNLSNVLKYKDRYFSHDNLFHTILGLMEIESETYVKGLDMLHLEEGIEVRM